MPFTYAEIRKLQKQFGMDELSTNEFAQLMNSQTKSNAFTAGIGGFGNLLKATSYGLDEAINATGAPKLLGDVGASMFGETGRHVFSTIPRMGANLVGTALGGIPGIAATAGAFALDTYEKTDSPGAAALSAALTPLVPLAGRAGGGITRGLINPTLTQPIAGTSLGLLKGPAASAAMQAGTVAGRPVTQLAAGGAVMNPFARGAIYGGTKLGETAGLTLQNAAVAATAAPKGQGWDAFSQSFAPESLAANALSLFPFVGKDLVSRGLHGSPAAREARFQSNYDNTLAKYSEANFGMNRDAMGTMAANVAQRPMLSLPENSSVPREFGTNRQGVLETTKINENIRDVDVATVRMGMDKKGRPTGDIRPSAIRVKWNETTPENKIKVLSEAPAGQRLEAAMTEVRVPASKLVEEIRALRSKGMPEAEALETVAQKYIRQATERVMKSTAQPTREDVVAPERNKFVEEFMANPPSPAHKAVYEDALSQLSASNTRLDATSVVSDKLRAWHADTKGKGDVESLQKALSEATQYTKRKGRNIQSRTPIGETDGTNYKTVEKGKRGGHVYYKSQLEAKQIRDQLASQYPEFQWVVDPKKKKGTWEILRYEHAETSGQASPKQKENLQVEELAKEVSGEKTKLQLGKDAKRAEQKAAIEVAAKQHRDNFLDDLPAEEYHQLGHQNEQRGRDRVEFLLELGEKGVPVKDVLKSLDESGLFLDENGVPDNSQIKEFLAEVGKIRQDYYNSRDQFFGEKDAVTEQTNLSFRRAKEAENLLKLAGLQPVLVDGKPGFQEIATGKVVRGSFAQHEALDAIMEFHVAGQRKIEGERVTLPELLKHAGLTEPEHIETALRLAELHDTDGITYWKAPENKIFQGLFRNKTGQLWLTNNRGKAAMLVLAHELNGHGLQNLHRQGKLDAESSKRMDRFEQFVASNTPEENQMMLREVFKQLPHELGKEAQIDIAMDYAGHPDEVMANINAAISLAMVTAKPSAWKSFMEWMPKPIADIVGVFAKYGRKFMEAISGSKYLSKDHQLRPETAKELHNYIDSLYQVMKFDGQRAERAREAMRLDVAMTPGAEMEALAGRDYFAFPASKESADMVKAFGLETDPVKAQQNEQNLYQKGSGAADRFVMPFVLFGRKFKEFAKIATVGQRREAANNRLENEILRNIGLHNDGIQYKADKASPVFIVEKDPNLARFRDTLQQRAQITKKAFGRSTVAENIAAKDDATMEVLKRMNPEQQRLVREAIIRQEEAQIASAKMWKDQTTERAIYQTAEIMMLKDPALTADTAQARAELLLDGLVNGKKPIPANEAEKAGMDFASLALDRINKTHDRMVNDPGFISSRRFGDYKFRVNYKDGRTTVLDAKTLGEQTQKMADLQMRADQEGIVSMEPLPLTKGTFDYKTAAMEFLKEREAGMREQLIQTLRANGIEPDTANDIATRFTLTGDLQREMSAKNLPTINLKRNFKEGWQELDMLDQQIEYMRMLTRGTTKATANAEFEMRMRDPKMLVHPERATARRAWELYNTPDPASVKAIQKFNYYKYLAFHFLNMLQDAVYPWNGTLAPLLVSEGAGIRDTYKRITKAAFRRGIDGKGKRLSPEEHAMLQRFREGNKGLSTYSDETNNEVIQAINARRIADNKQPYSMTDTYVKMPFNWLLNASKGMHKHFTDFSAETSLLAAFDHYTKRGMNAKDAEAAAFKTVTETIGGGKAGRPVGVWDSGKFKPLSASMMSLQTFGLLQVGTWKIMAEKALGQIPGLSKAERTAAAKSFGLQSAAMFATAGLFGLPFVGAILTTIDKTFDVNSREWLAKQFHKLDSTEDNHVFQQVALHGAANQLSGLDYASRGQIPGVLGLNARDGFSLDALAGPTWSLMKDLFGGASSVATGDPGRGLATLAPNNLKRVLDQWREDFEFRQKDGTLLGESTPLDKGVYTVLGLRPNEISRRMERDQWQKRDAEIQKADRRKWLDETVDGLSAGELDLQKAIADRLEDHPEEDANALAQSVVEHYLDRTQPYDSRRLPGSSTELNQVAAATQPSSTELQRLQMLEQLKQTLQIGRPAGQSRYRTASQVDQLRLGNPNISYGEALDVLNNNGLLNQYGLGGHSGGLGRLSGLAGLPRLGGL